MYLISKGARDLKNLGLNSCNTSCGQVKNAFRRFEIALFVVFLSFISRRKYSSLKEGSVEQA